MGLISGASWFIGSGIIIILFGFLYIVGSGNRDAGAGAHFMLGFFIVLIGALLCYAGKKLKSKAEYVRENTEPIQSEKSEGRSWWRLSRESERFLRMDNFWSRMTRRR